MNKKQVIFIVVVSIFFSWLFNFLFGRSLSAKVSTWPVLNRWHILSPQAPIVINNQQTVRVSGGGDLSSTAIAVNPRISAVILVSGGTVQLTGNALNLTSDGNFITGADSFSQPGAYYVELSDGHTAPIISQTADLATSLVFFKASVTGVAAVNFVSSRDAAAGQLLAFAAASLRSQTDKIVPGIVNSPQSDVLGKIFQSDYPRDGYVALASGPLISGQGIFNSSGDNLGIWNGKEIISSDVLKQASDLYLSNTTKISRPSFGFSYQETSGTESSLSGQPAGALVKAVSAVRQAGLQPGDVITAVNGQTVTDDNSLVQLLSTVKAGDSVDFSVIRDKTIMDVKLTASELKQ